MMIIRHDFDDPIQLTISSQCTAAALSAHAIPIVALHGWLDNSGSFRPLMDLYPQWPWIALDLIGHGQSQWRSTDSFYNFHDYLCDIGLWIEREYPQGIHLMGHSLGAAIVTILAGLFPDKVKSLVLFDGLGPLVSSVETFPEQFRLSLKQFQNPRPLRTYESLEQMALARKKRHILEHDSAFILATYGHRKIDNLAYQWSFDPKLFGLSPLQLTQEQVLVTLKEIRCPVFFLKANQGYPYDQELLNQRIQEVKNIEVFHMDGGHHVHMDYHHSVAEIIHHFYHHHHIQFTHDSNK